MTTNDRPEQPDDQPQVDDPPDVTALTETQQTGLSPEDAAQRVPTAPEDMPESEQQQLQTQADSLVQDLQSASGSQEMELADQIGNLGSDAQDRAAGELNLLRTRVGELLSREGTESEVTKDLTDLRVAINEINPHEMDDPGPLRKALSFVPFLGDTALSVLERIAIRYEPVSKQVEVIESRLREGRNMLNRDNVELRQLYEQVEEQQKSIKKNAYLGELVMQRLTDVQEEVEDERKRERVTTALHDVAMRVQDLRAMEEIYNQFFVSIEMSRQNNTRLGQSVDRTVSLATNVVTVGLAIQSALSRQKRVMEANRRTQEYLGNLITSNAATIKQHTTEIGDVYNQPVVAMEKITQAHNDLMEAMDTADRIKQEGIQTARQNISKLSELSEELSNRSASLRESAERANTPSVEA